MAWLARLRDVYGQEDPNGPDGPWYDSLAEEDRARLLRVAREYNAQYILTDAAPALDFPLLYRNDTYAVYRLPE